MKIKRRYPNFVDVYHPDNWEEFEVNNIEDIENINWVKERWMKKKGYRLVWNENVILDRIKYPTCIMVRHIMEESDEGIKVRHDIIFLCEGNADVLGINKIYF